MKKQIFILDSFEHSLMVQVLKNLKAGKPVEIPIYDFCNNSRYINFTSLII